MSDAPPAAAVQDAPDLTDAARDVLAERERQKSIEGWMPEHDDEHTNGELSHAAAAYAIGPGWPFPGGNDMAPPCWPWNREWWKPAGNRRNLVKAGALILAEIERLDRALARQPEGTR